MNSSGRWRAVLARDREQDGRFFYAVRTTGVYCRPSCPSRRPRRGSVEFFATYADAERAGYRACLRCQPALAPSSTRAVKAACRFIEGRLEQPVSLAAAARAAGLSPSHLQRLFKRELGLTPRQYQEAKRMERLKAELAKGGTVTSALYDAGFGSPSRLYEKATRHLGMAPRAYRRRGAGVVITYSIVPSRLGQILLAATDRGVCNLRMGDDASALAAGLAEEFPAAQIVRDDRRLRPWSQAVQAYVRGACPNLDLPLDIRATAFQRRVWDLLLAIPHGETRSYGDIARQLGEARAYRAVARACASNPVALAIPCHRVLNQQGELAGYRWGVERKAALLRQEKARPAPTA